MDSAAPASSDSFFQRQYVSQEIPVRMTLILVQVPQNGFNRRHRFATTAAYEPKYTTKTVPICGYFDERASPTFGPVVEEIEEHRHTTRVRTEIKDVVSHSS